MIQFISMCSAKYKIYLIFSLLTFLPFGAAFCWKPRHNPFLGEPGTARLDASTVRVSWAHIFSNATACQDVDFLIKSHPLHSPANYKLSDFTLRGQRSASLAVPPGEDFIFQVIARENKGPGHGIEYAYSRPSTSLSNPTVQKTNQLRRSIWIAGTSPHAGSSPHAGAGSQNGGASSQGGGSGPRHAVTVPTTRRPVVTTTQRSTTTRRTTVRTTTRPPPPPTTRPPPPPPTTTPRTTTVTTYLKPSLRSLDLDYDYYNEVGVAEAGGSPWYIYECIPLLKNLAGFGEGSNNNKVLKQFIQHMNKATVNAVKAFVGDKRKCHDQNRSGGHLVNHDGKTECCSTPWRGNHDCYTQFVACDGGCVPQEWVADGWPDCLDGTDEMDQLQTKAIPYQLGCVHCAGVVLSAGFLCRDNIHGLTRACLEDVMGPGQCNGCIGEYLDLP